MLLARRKPERLADGLERAVRAVREPRDALTAVVPVQAGQVRTARALMLELADQLRCAEEVPPDVLRSVDRLLTDSCGPLFSPAPPGALHDRILDAILALEHGGTHTP